MARSVIPMATFRTTSMILSLVDPLVSSPIRLIGQQTTFLNNTFSSFVDGREIKPHDGARTSVEDFRANPDKLCTHFTVENVENMERIHYAVQVGQR